MEITSLDSSEKIKNMSDININLEIENLLMTLEGK